MTPAVDAAYRLVLEDVFANTVTTSGHAVNVSPVIFELSQESAPGVGDFDDNVLGMITPYSSDLTAAAYYGWTNGATPFSGPDPQLTDNRSHVFLVAGADGLALYVVHDDGAGPAGGRAETEVSLDGDTATFMVRDDAGSDIFNELDGGTLFQIRNIWISPYTDGYAIGQLNCAWSAVIQFADLFAGDPTISGLDSWVAYTADGEDVTLTLQEGRAVRINAIVGSCPADLDDNGSVGASDLLALLASWGPCKGCPADFDGNGNVGASDLLQLLADWGPCPK